MKTEIKEIPFNGGSLLGVRTPDGTVWLAVRKACRDIGLTDAQARAEVSKMQESLLLKDNCKKLSLKFETQVRETLVLSEKFVPMWLAQINLTPAMQKKNPDAVQKLLKYQLEASDVLHEAFYGTEEQKLALHSSLGLEGQIATLEQKLEMTVVKLNSVENALHTQTENLNSVMDNMTLTTVQQGRLQRAVKDRVNHLLGGAHSKEYKENSKLYFINLWNGLKEKFGCGSRWKDLNPKYNHEAFSYVSTWEYSEV